MSSQKFGIELTPEPRLRRAVFAAGLLSAIVGTVLMLGLPVAWRAWPALAWVCFSAVELAGWLDTGARTGALQLAPGGEVVCRGRDGSLHKGRLAAGSVIGRRLAWLCVQFDDGRSHGTLYAGRDDDPDWRRLRVIREHLD